MNKVLRGLELDQMQEFATPKPIGALLGLLCFEAAQICGVALPVGG
jgi:hypothetical protein